MHFLRSEDDMENNEDIKMHWCPLEGTDYEGYCHEHFATIRVKSWKCNHHDDCLKIKEDLDRKKNEG